MIGFVLNSGKGKRQKSFKAELNIDSNGFGWIMNQQSSEHLSADVESANGQKSIQFRTINPRLD